MPSTEQLDQQAPARSLDRDRVSNIDLQDLFSGDDEARALLVEQIRVACLDPGFFYIHNTCVGNDVVQNSLAAMQTFFALPDDSPVKRDVHNKHLSGLKGWTPIFGEPAYQKDTIAHVESFDIGQQLTADQYRNLGLEPNIWPDLPGFRDTVLDYYQQITRLGRALSEVFAEILGVERHFINDNSREKAPRTLRLLHYPANDAPVDKRNVGIAAHTDFECFTIMNQTASGLELTDVGGRWCEAPSDIGAFTVILGDMMERFSNGWLKATGHRVVNTPWTRYSMILFFAVDGDYTVAPLPRFISPDNPEKYDPVTQDEHIARELERSEAYRQEASGQRAL
ncbi:MAG: isopenicillin N synthase family dioxygenase [Woeseia sp.]